VRRFLFTFVGLLTAMSSTAHALTALPNVHRMDLPSRPLQATSGTAFLRKIESLSPAQREAAFVREILRGNVPDFLRQMTPVEVVLREGPYKGQLLRFWTLPDYLAVGSDRDFVRVPLNLHSIEKVAEKLDLSLPTSRMVDDIYRNADVKLTPAPLPYSPRVASTGNILRHNKILQSQLDPVCIRPGILLAGHKKDVVQSRRLVKKPDAIAIYGWHRPGAEPIQPLSTVHSAEYADYSHGVRLVSNTIRIGSRTFDLREVLNHRWMAKTLSAEGVIPQKGIRPKTVFPVADNH